MSKTRLDTPDNWIAKIAEAALSGDRHSLELTIVTAIRSIKPSHPEISLSLSNLLNSSSVNGSAFRWNGSPPPVDQEEGFSLIRTEDVDAADKPALNELIQSDVDRFINERRLAAQFISEGYKPAGSILLTGKPGTGKTMLSRWIARSLQMPFVTLDLATTISSLLGKTGYNLRRILDYARNRPCVLLLDEFDAIGKRRDDASDLGELKRIVNVLLKELEVWPLNSVLIAATNHPELLDTAIQRRFDLIINLPLPDQKQIEEMILKMGGRFAASHLKDLIPACATVMTGMNGSDVERIVNAAVRQHIVTNEPFQLSFLQELLKYKQHAMNKKQINSMINLFARSNGGKYTVRELSKLFGKSVGAIHYHVQKGAKQ